MVMEAQVLLGSFLNTRQQLGNGLVAKSDGYLVTKLIRLAVG